MFTKYFGLFLMAGGVAASFVSLFYNGLYIDRDTGSIKTDQDLFFGILISIAIILATFFIGKYLYKIGKAEKTSTNLKMNKFVKIAAILFVASILIIPLSYFAVSVLCESPICYDDDWVMPVYILVFGVGSAMIMSGVAIILLIIHWLKNRGLK